MTVGTVHALQGAERDVVIFSPVYSKHADGGFIDLSPSMLNVAVSRAKDAFLVFGDMDTLASAPPGSPRSVLDAFSQVTAQTRSCSMCLREPICRKGTNARNVARCGRA